MFLNQLRDIYQIIPKVSCAVFVIPPNTPLKLPHALYLRPSDDKKTNIITIDQLRDFIALAHSHETRDRYFVITPADAMNEAAQNAFLKAYEEPSEHCHFILLTEHPGLLLPTILSRSQIFYLRQEGTLDTAPAAKDKIVALAKQLISAQPCDLPSLATELAKNKTQPRQHACEIVSTAIELLYKSYFKTGNEKFLTKLPAFIQLYDNLTQNGHIKLHIVADLC